MEDVQTLPRSRALTREDLEAMPDDGHRYELIDGALVVTPAPNWRHQLVVVALVVALRERCPSDLVVFVAPLDVELAEDTVLQPDVLVARRADLDDHGLPAAPVLAIEVLSPSTRLIDHTLKRSRFEVAGCLSYWVVDPETPSLTAWELGTSGYTELAHVRGDDQFEATLPYPLTISPRDLTRG